MISGALAAAGLAFLLVYSIKPSSLELEGIVEPGGRFVVTAQAGELRWTTTEHGHADGLRIAHEGSIQLERGEQLEVEVEVEAGQDVAAGDAILTVESRRLDRVLDELEAERSATQARMDLLLAGGRPETIASAQKNVELARAQLQAALRESERLSAISQSAAIATVERDAADNLVKVRERELALAQAQVSEARLPPRAAEIAELNATLAGVDSRLVEARQREAMSTVLSPLSGQVSEAREGELVAITAAGARYVRIPLPQAELDRVHVGDAVEFHAGSNEVPGQVVDISREARPLGTEAVYWVAVLLEDEGLAPGATGTARFLGEGS
jgi:multidrug efflux pump subunit AcrA (membrane-fusion protein)